MLVRTGRTLYKIVFILLMFLILALNMQPVSVDYEAGEIADEDMQGILEKILRLAKKKNTVWRRLGDAEPEADYTKKILFVLYDPQSNNALAEDDLQNIVWYFLDE